MHLPLSAGPRRRTRRALLAAALPAVLAAVALPVAAEANNVSLSTDSLNQGLMQYVQTAAQPSSVSTEIKNGAVHIRSTSGIQDLVGAACRRVDAFEVSCSGAEVDQITLIGHNGDDEFVPRTALPTLLIGLGGNDHYVGAAGTSRSRVDFRGGLGIDSANYALASSGVSVSKDERADDGRFAFDEDNIREDVERLMGSQHGDILSGSDSTSVVDRLVGGLGNDSLSGNGGNDAFEMGAVADGADRITGGPGNDRVSYTDRTRPVNATLNFGGADDGEAGEGDEIVGANEVIIGGQAGDTLRAPAGSTAAHSLFGGGGNDTLAGADGPDLLNGGSGSDALVANGGDDEIHAADREPDTVGCGLGTDSAPAWTPATDSPAARTAR